MVWPRTLFCRESSSSGRPTTGQVRFFERSLDNINAIIAFFLVHSKPHSFSSLKAFPPQSTASSSKRQTACGAAKVKEKPSARNSKRGGAGYLARRAQASDKAK
eukprot:GHVT01025173.1.p3 GENE.GHVT01025173.1~~GHVT01025173.1.p3  ORF type:complete len:104 (-),score=16.84 GHVT01025173.1:1766-2077(-)